MKRGSIAAVAALVIVASVTVVFVELGRRRALADRSCRNKNCSFTLRVGDVLPFTGSLAAYGGNMDRP